MAFRYQTNKYHYLFALAGGKEARLVVRRPLDKAYREAEWRTIATKPFAYELNKKYYTLKIENQGPRIRAYVDGKLVIEASDEEIKGGKIGLAATSPARYQAVKVTACTATKTRHRRPHQAARRRSWPGCAPTTPSPSCGSASPPPSSAPAATSASATSTATASWTC